MRIRFALKWLLGAFLVVLLLSASPHKAQALLVDKFVVDSTDDSDTGACTSAPDDCTLRGAINDANTDANLCAAIYFTAPAVILSMPLPPLEKNCLTVDGTDGNGNYVGPRIDGLLMTTAGPGLEVLSSQNVTISNLKIVNIPAGFYDIYLNPSSTVGSNVQIANNDLGILPGATSCTGPGAKGGIYAYPEQTYSGAPYDPLYIYGNVISCNGDGIYLGAVTVIVNGQPPSTYGADRAHIGGKPDGSTAGNYIGTTSDGTGGPGNSGDGIFADHPFLLDVRGNVISANGSIGIQLLNASGTSVENNKIGTDVTGNLSLPNHSVGITVDQSPSVYVRSNIIADNNNLGIWVTGSDSHTLIQQNDIYGNQGIPIGLGGTNFFANGTKAPPGPNNFLPYPVISSNTGNVLHGTACANCSIDLFTAVGDPTMAGGGGKFLDEFNADGSGAWTYTLPAGYSNPYVAATATGVGTNTSEMSPRFQLTGVTTLPFHLFLPLVVK